MIRTYKAKVILEVEVKAGNAPEAEEVLHRMFEIDDKELEISVIDCDVALVGNFNRPKSIV